MPAKILLFSHVMLVQFVGDSRMSNRETHRVAAIIAGMVVGAHNARGLPPDRAWLVFISNILGASLGGPLPDIGDPPTSPNHRHIAHGAVNATVAGYFCLKSLGEWQRSLHARADELKWSRQFLPDVESRSSSALAELLLRVIAHGLPGFLAGYASHLALDATTPRGLPLVTRDF